MSTKSRTVVHAGSRNSNATVAPAFHVINGSPAAKPTTPTIKDKRFAATTKRNSLTSPTQSSKAKAVVKASPPKRAVVAKVITAESLKAAAKKNISSQASASPTASISASTPTPISTLNKPTSVTSKNTVSKATTVQANSVDAKTKPTNSTSTTAAVPERKVQTKRPLVDDGDDIYAFYAKKKQRQEEMLKASKSPLTHSSPKTTTSVKVTTSTSQVTKQEHSNNSSVEPPAKRKATVQAVQAASTPKRK